MVCAFVDVGSSRLRASDSPRSDWLGVSEVCLLRVRLCGYAATTLTYQCIQRPGMIC
jgi:hypothetical protein